MSSVIPRPDKDVKYESLQLNEGYRCSSVHRNETSHQMGKECFMGLPVHCLVLERFKYFDFIQSHMYLRIVKPVNKYFVKASSTWILDLVGLHLIRSYVLQAMVVLKKCLYMGPDSDNSGTLEVQE